VSFSIVVINFPHEGQFWLFFIN